jgi:predicted transcriptional regulator of viral defense system
MRETFLQAKNLFLQHRGLLRSAQAQSLGINPKTLGDMVAAGLLVKEARGLYQLAETEPPANPDLVYVTRLIPDAVVCLISALAVYQLTTQIPHKVYIALPRKNRKAPRLAYPPLQIIWLQDKPYQSGQVNYSIDGFDIPIYDPEKTIADCFKFRNKIGQDVALEALTTYMKRPRPNINQLMKYARVDRIKNILTPYLEVLA